MSGILTTEKQADPMQFLTISQAANLLNLPTHRIRIMIHRNELPALKVGTQWRVRKSEVIKFIQGLEER
jgi:excisionase family DNA binding protein